MQAEFEGTSIVLVGAFNPTIFQPAWFVARDLLRKDEGEAATVEVVHPEVVSFKLEWAHLVVTRERFSLTTNQVRGIELVRDLTVGTFKLLAHTPANMMGINRDFHFSATVERVNEIGHRLAPKEPWRDVLDKPLLRSMAMQGERPDGLEGLVYVRVEPSQLIKPGVFIGVNDHFQTGAELKVEQGCGRLIEILEAQWNASVSRADKIAQTLIEKT